MMLSREGPDRPPPVYEMLRRDYPLILVVQRIREPPPHLTFSDSSAEPSVRFPNQSAPSRAKVKLARTLLRRSFSIQPSRGQKTPICERALLGRGFMANPTWVFFIVSRSFLSEVRRMLAYRRYLSTAGPIQTRFVGLAAFRQRRGNGVRKTVALPAAQAHHGVDNQARPSGATDPRGRARD